MSALPAGGAGNWITPPPLDDGSSVWSSEEYTSSFESSYLTDTGYASAARYAASYPRRADYTPTYPYYANNADPNVALPPYWPRPVATLPLDGFAVAALIFGIIGGWIFGIGFGVAALSRINRGERRGRGLAIAGLWLSAAWLLILAFAVALPLYLNR